MEELPEASCDQATILVEVNFDASFRDSGPLL